MEFTSSPLVMDQADYTFSTNSTKWNDSIIMTSRNINRHLGLQVQLYISPLLVLLGTAGNMMSFIVLLQRRMRTIAMYNFLLILAVADTNVLLFSCLRSWIRGVSGFELLHVSESVCTTITFLFLSSSYLASWLIVLMTIDRFLAVWFPLDEQCKWSIGQARGAAVALIILSMASNAHVFWTFGLYRSHGQTKCTFDHDIQFMFHGFDYLKLAVYCFIPFIVVLIVNTLIIVRLKKNPGILRNRRNQTVYRPGFFDTCSSQPGERIPCLLLTVSFTWLFLMLPYSLMRFVAVLHNSSLLRIMCFMLMYANHSINFFLYCVTGRKFREELRLLLRTLRLSHRRNRGRGASQSGSLLATGILYRARRNNSNGTTNRRSESRTSFTITLPQTKGILASESLTRMNALNETE